MSAQAAQIQVSNSATPKPTITQLHSTPEQLALAEERRTIRAKRAEEKKKNLAPLKPLFDEEKGHTIPRQWIECRPEIDSDQHLPVKFMTWNVSTSYDANLVFSSSSCQSFWRKALLVSAMKTRTCRCPYHDGVISRKGFVPD